MLSGEPWSFVFLKLPRAGGFLSQDLQRIFLPIEVARCAVCDRGLSASLINQKTDGLLNMGSLLDLFDMRPRVHASRVTRMAMNRKVCSAFQSPSGDFRRMPMTLG